MTRTPNQILLKLTTFQSVKIWLMHCFVVWFTVWLYCCGVQPFTSKLVVVVVNIENFALDEFEDQINNGDLFQNLTNPLFGDKLVQIFC